MKNLLFAASLSLSGSLAAASLSWDDANADNGWNSTSTNWNGGSSWTNDNDAVFGGTGETVTLDSGISAAGLLFNVDGYTLSGSTLTLAGAAPSVMVANAGDSATLAASLSVAGTFTKSGQGTLVLNAANTLGAVNVTAGTLALIGDYSGNRLSPGATVTVQAGATADIRADNPIPNGSRANAVNFVINGGTLTSTGGSHTHLGDLTLRNGGTLTTGNGAGAYDSERWKVWGDITVANTGGDTSAATISGNGLGLTGERTFNVADVTGDTAPDLVVSAALNNAENAVGSLRKTGAGTLRLSSAAGYSASYSGSTTVSEGVLELNATNMFVGSHGFALADTQVLVAEGSGTLVIGESFVSRIGNITLHDGGTLTSNKSLNYYDALLGNVASGAATVRVTGSGAATMNGTGGLHLQGVQNFDVADTTGDAGSDLLVSLTLGDPGAEGGAAGGVNKLGAGTMTIATRATYAGGTNVNAGVLDLAGGGGAQGAIRGAVTVNPGATLRLSTGDATGHDGGSTALTSLHLAGGTLEVNTAANQTLGDATINMTGASITGVAGANLDFFKGASTLNALASDTTSTISGTRLSIRQGTGLTLTVEDGAAATDLLINSVIANHAGFADAPLIKAGAGKLVLAGVNTYTGKTTVSAGTLEVTGTVRVNGAAGITVADGAALSLNGTLKLTSDTDTLLNNGALAAGGVLDLGGLFDSFNGGADGAYNLISGTAATGAFSSIQGYDTGVWSSVSFDSASGSLNFTAVPEPSTYGLLGAGFLAMASFLRRRQKAAR